MDRERTRKKRLATTSTAGGGEMKKKGIKVSINHTGEKVAAAKRKHGWADRDLFKKPRTSAKKGGEAAWVAKECVLKQIFLDCT